MQVGSEVHGHPGPYRPWLQGMKVRVENAARGLSRARSRAPPARPGGAPQSRDGASHSLCAASASGPTTPTSHGPIAPARLRSRSRWFHARGRAEESTPLQRHEVPLQGAESWGGGGWGRTASAPPCGRVRAVWRRCPVPARPSDARRPYDSIVQFNGLRICSIRRVDSHRPRGGSQAAACAKPGRTGIK